MSVRLCFVVRLFSYLETREMAIFLRKQRGFPYWNFIELNLKNKYSSELQTQETKKETKKIKAITQSWLAIYPTSVDI